MNFIKMRGDKECIQLEPIKSANSGDDIKFRTDKLSSSWLEKIDNITLADLRKGIEPWLTALFQSEHLSLLTGTGLSIAVQSIATTQATNAMEIPNLKTNYAEKIRIAATTSARNFGHGTTPNIEDYIRVINELIKGLQILGHNEEAENTDDRKNYDTLCQELDSIVEDFLNKISKLENSIITSDDPQKTLAMDTLICFLVSFASRVGTRDRLNIFTTNYDRLIEAGAELAGIRLVDRFIGTLSPILNSSRIDIDMHYNPPGIRGEPRYLEGLAKFTKLHGSIDWVEYDGLIRRLGIPFGAINYKPYYEANGLQKIPVTNTLIYPNSSKDKETAEYPYVELFRDFAAALCRPNHTLVTYGYSFGDDHINRVIRDMLTIPSTHLIIMAYNDTADRIKNFVTSIGRSTQISILLGPDIANLSTLVSWFLPKSSIDRTSIKMSELLKKRYITASDNEQTEETSNANTDSIS